MIKTLHELAKEFPNKSYNELDKMRLSQLPKLKQDIVKSVFQVESIIQRKLSEKK